MAKGQKRWTKKRHAIIFGILRPFFKLHFKIKYNFSAAKNEKEVPKPSLVMSNHLTTMDPFMTALSFKRPLYFIASDDLFTIPVASPLIKFLVAPIPKSKSKSDFNTIRSTLKVLKEGGTVLLFPEGNRSLSGGNWDIDISTAKLVKMCKVPLVLYNIKGGYGADPRWGRSVRKGKVFGGVRKILQPEEIEKMSVEEVLEVIKKELITNDFDLNINFKSKTRAEYLERALYYCENCKSFNTLYSKGENIYCKNCEFSAEYSEDLKLKKEKGELLSTNISEYFEKAKDKLYEFANENHGNLFFDKDVYARLVVDKKRIKLGSADISATSEGCVVEVKNGQVFVVKFDELIGATIVGKRKINFYLPDGRTLQIKGNKRFNSVKYLHLYEFKKKGEKE